MNLVDLTQALADEGVERRIHQLVIMDELWRPMRAAPRMVQRIDSLTTVEPHEGRGHDEVHAHDERLPRAR